jgi:hypothetical protein
MTREQTAGVSNVAGDWFDRMRKLAVPSPELLLFGPAQVVQLTAAAVKASLVGRRRRFELAGRRVTAEIVDLAVGTGPGLAVGQFDDVHLELKDVDWEGRRVTTLRVTGRNVHLRPAVTPTFVTAPVLVTAMVDEDALPTWSSPWARRFTLEIGDDAVARIHLRDREHLGALEVEIRVDSGALVVDPSALRAGRRRVTALGRLPPNRVPLTLPHGIRLTSVTLEPRAVRVEAMVPEWSEPLVVGDVQRFVRLLAPDLDPVIVPLRPRRGP